MRIYLDVCCLNRPFDDQRQDRIHLESEAVLTILKHIESGKWKLISSDAIIYEINKIPDIERKNKILIEISKATIFLKAEPALIFRAKEIQKMGIKSYDALHVASAEIGNADVFLSTDDNLLKILSRNSNAVNIKTDNPLSWIKEIL